jgi:hypothetical protein
VLAIVAILSLLVAILIPSLQKARQQKEDRDKISFVSVSSGVWVFDLGPNIDAGDGIRDFRDKHPELRITSTTIDASRALRRLIIVTEKVDMTLEKK